MWPTFATYPQVTTHLRGDILTVGRNLPNCQPMPPTTDTPATQGKPGDLLTIPEVATLIETITGLRCPIRTVNRWAAQDPPKLATKRIAGKTRLIERREAVRRAREFARERTVQADA